jgi:DnaJ-class molecular chaperone
MICDNCEGTGKIIVYGPGLNEQNVMVYALAIYHPCPDCDGCGLTGDEEE